MQPMQHNRIKHKQTSELDAINTFFEKLNFIYIINYISIIYNNYTTNINTINFIIILHYT